MIYEVECANCSFKAIIKGTHEDVLDAVEQHQEDHRNEDTNHFVEFRGVLTDAFENGTTNQAEIIFDDGVKSPDEFKDVLSTLLKSAFSNGIDVEGEWVARNENELPDWKIVVCEIERDE